MTRTQKRRLQRKRLACKITEQQWFDALSPARQARVLARRQMSPQAAWNDMMNEWMGEVADSLKAPSILYDRLSRK